LCVGGQGGAGVEAEPSEPEDAGAEDGHGEVVGDVGLFTEPAPRADDQTAGQGRRG
jgi:hypothetical protein